MATLIKFRRTIVQPVDGTDFIVNLPSTLDNDTYGVFVELIQGANLPGFMLPDIIAGDRTTTAFRVITTSELDDGDVLEFTVVQ